MLADRWFTVDRDYRVVGVGLGANPILAQSIGMVLWDVFPGSQQVYQPIYEAAWQDGTTTAVAFFAGTIAKVTAVVRDDVLLVSYHDLPLVGLQHALSQYEQWKRELDLPSVDGRLSRRRRKPPRRARQGGNGH